MSSRGEQRQHGYRRYYPALLDVRDRPCVVVGGGRVAERKVAKLLACGARVRVISPRLTPQLQAWAEAGRLSWQARPYVTGDVADAWLVFAATDQPAVNRAVQAEAEQARCWLNAADHPAACSLVVPASVQVGPLVVALATSATDPATARRLRELLEQELASGESAFAQAARAFLQAQSSPDRLAEETAGFNSQAMGAGGADGEPEAGAEER
ncbi:MAG: bifunctional precorrin-2 dehydrogenase/sirohydrochlorin ferrochelatase [Alicyclobacillus sp.]|nr:bifunctional precorrin-2 dehydrogenase/sirohydrochlorin ferrochelatase [Alicyclobacillus sp.]